MGKYVYEFTAENGPEDFPTLGVTLTEAGQTIESDVEVEHARLKLVSPKPKKDKAPAADSTSEVKE